MNEEMWSELEAQVESHGFEAIEFHLTHSDDKIFYIQDIKFEDGAIKVTLE